MLELVRTADYSILEELYIPSHRPPKERRLAEYSSSHIGSGVKFGGEVENVEC